jgi:hypothetical protein
MSRLGGEELLKPFEKFGALLLILRNYDEVTTLEDQCDHMLSLNSIERRPPDEPSSLVVVAVQPTLYYLRKVTQGQVAFSTVHLGNYM